MKLRLVLTALLWACLTTNWPTAGRCAENDPEVARAQEETRQAWREVDRWLGRDLNARRWRRFLRGGELEDQWSSSAPADHRVLNRMRARLSSGEPGLDHPRFSRLRGALDRWALAVEQRRSQSALAKAREVREAAKVYSADDLEAARQELKMAMSNLDALLRPAGKRGEDWKEHLLWDDLQAQLDSKQPPDANQLQQISTRYRGQAGLDLPAFARVRTALGNLLPRARVRQDARFAERYAALIDGVTKRLEAYEADPASKEKELREVALTMGWLEERQQAPELVQLVRSRYSQPNLHVRLSESLASLAMGQAVSRPTEIADFVLGASVCGHGQLDGKVFVDFQPSQQRAILDTRFQGVLVTNTVGSKGPAQVHNLGHTQLNAVNRLTLDELGLHGSRTVAQACTSNQLTAVCSTSPRLRGRIVRRVATRKANQLQGQAEAIASQKAETEFSKQMDNDLGKQVATANDSVSLKLRYPLERRNLYPALLDFSTTDDLLIATSLLSSSSQFGAFSAPPALLDDASLALRVHQSGPNNAFHTLLAGETFDEPKLQALLKDLLGSVPEEMKSEEGRDPWSITFDAREPVTIEFRDGAVHITVRGTRYTSGDGKYAAMNVATNYRFEHKDDRWKLVRPDELDILPPGFDPAKDTLGLRQTTLRTLLKKRFDKLFPPAIDLEGFALKDRLEKAGTFWIVEQGADRGWLTLSWRHDPTRKPLPAQPVVAAR